jgi:hypothetical protein
MSDGGNREERLIGTVSFHLAAENAPCPICGRHSRQFASEYPSREAFFRDLGVLWCEQCGSGWVPGAGRMTADYYATNYRGITPRRKAPPADVFADRSLAKDERFARAVAQKRAIERHGATFDTVYDFGFGLGFFLFATAAPKKLGFDIDPQTLPFAEFLSIKTAAPWEIPIASVDCLLSSHSMEHLAAENFDRHISAFYAILKPRGLFAVEVPHAALSWLEKPGVHRPHTIFFSAEGLQCSLVRHGFTILERGFAEDGPVAGLSQCAIYDPRSTDAFYSSRNSSALFIVCMK